MKAKIDEIIELLYDYNLDRVEILKKENPNLIKLLKRGVTLGDSENEELIAKIDICIAGLETGNIVCKEYLPKIKKQIKLLNKVQLFSQIIITISGASIISLLKEEGLFWIKYPVAILILISSLLTIFFQYKSNPIFSSSNNLFQVFEFLVDSQVEIEYKLSEINFFKKYLNDNNKIRAIDMINSSNTLCLDIRKTVNKIT